MEDSKNEYANQLQKTNELQVQFSKPQRGGDKSRVSLLSQLYPAVTVSFTPKISIFFATLSQIWLNE